MPLSPEWAAIAAKRALLREQTELLGQELDWLSDPGRIPLDALGPATKHGDVPSRCFSLATWFLIEIVRAAKGVCSRLRWEETLDQHRVPAQLWTRVSHAVMEPTSRYAPGIYAMAELVAVAPPVALRESIPLSDWGSIARRTEKFATKMSCDGTELQVIIRDYLRKRISATEAASQRVLDPALLRLDDTMSLTSVTPIEDLVAVANAAIRKYIRPTKGVCVAMLAHAPYGDQERAAPSTMYGAVWSAFAGAAERLVFPNIDLSTVDRSPPCGQDPDFATLIDALARQRALALKQGNSAKSWHTAKELAKEMLDGQVQQPQPSTTQLELLEKVEALFGTTSGRSNGL
ncbi:hypothetical protein LMG28727_06207 [Paraburkholderia kirstenboschensis]|uniref:hypothetical protein n=1 Tax=Paraburkholderia kirstenboschensis TaxID=1245436 RepID=UPI000A5003F0|nr:hypothetical protein [Paraburkholderia kirstenboschensis]CAD6556834.1 hypothetical protein LMG28727_06207 [Paraburkholderia kirstenboschensis]